MATIETIIDDVETVSPQYFIDREIDPKKIVVLILTGMVRTVAPETFEDCGGLKTVTADTVETVGDHAFLFCKGITSLSLPMVKSIGTQAFERCEGITSLSLPSVQSIGYRAFESCEGITSLSLSSVQSIGDSAFIGCEGIDSLSLPMVQSIADDAFNHCIGITSLYLPTVQSIGDGAFGECKGIKSVTVPAGCKMGEDAFPAGCKVVTAGSTVSDADAASTGNDQGPDADWVADQSADASAPGKRKATGIKKKAKKRKGGYTDKGRLAFKSEGGVLATGHARTCIPDALFVLLSTLLTTPPDLETVRTAIMGGDLYKDALFTTAQAYIESLGRLSPTSPPLHHLPCVTKEFLLKGGPAYHLLNTTGRLFLVHLLVSYGPDDKEPDDHCVAYDGLTVRDNGQYKKVKELDDGDRSSPEKARDVFDSLYKGMMVRIKNVYELL